MFISSTSSTSSTQMSVTRVSAARALRFVSSSAASASSASSASPASSASFISSASFTSFTRFISRSFSCYVSVKIRASRRAARALKISNLKSDFLIFEHVINLIKQIKICTNIITNLQGLRFNKRVIY